MQECSRNAAVPSSAARMSPGGHVVTFKRRSVSLNHLRLRRRSSSFSASPTLAMLAPQKRPLPLELPASEMPMLKRARRQWPSQPASVPPSTVKGPRLTRKNAPCTLVDSSLVVTPPSSPSSLLSLSSASPSSSSAASSPSSSPPPPSPISPSPSSNTPSPPSPPSLPHTPLSPPTLTIPQDNTCPKAPSGQPSAPLSWDDLSPGEQSRLSARYKDTFDRIWSGSILIFRWTVGLYELIVQLGLWTGTRGEYKQLTRAFPDLTGVLQRAQDTGDLHEISTHREFGLMTSFHPWPYIVHSRLL